MFSSKLMDDSTTSSQNRADSFCDSCGRWSRRLALTLALGLNFVATGAMAQTTRLATVEVTPLVADVNVERHIKVSGTWPHACGPLSASVAAPGVNVTGSVVVRLVVPQTFAACAQVLTPYSFTVNYTPTQRGVMKIAVLTNDGEFLGDGSIVTRGADDNSAFSDVTGVWYDPLTNGSGLTFIHDGANVLFGTWYVYDSQGKPRWYTIQSVQWKQQGKVFEGTIYETVGRSVTCPAPFLACPVEMSSVSPIGIARFTLITPTTAKIEALTSLGQLLFSSNLVRIAI